MLRPEQYALLYSALGDRGIKLINDPRRRPFSPHL